MTPLIRSQTTKSPLARAGMAAALALMSLTPAVAAAAGRPVNIRAHAPSRTPVVESCRAAISRTALRISHNAKPRTVRRATFAGRVGVGQTRPEQRDAFFRGRVDNVECSRRPSFAPRRVPHPGVRRFPPLTQGRSSPPPVAGTAITTVAGGGSGLGPTSAQALQLGQQPDGGFIAGGFLYLADAGDVIRKVNLSTGVETVVVGTGTIGYSGDGGPATLAHISQPQGLFVDASGNMYFAQPWTNEVHGGGVVRMVAAETTSPFLPGQTLTKGDIYTIAGSTSVYNYQSGVPALSTYLDGEPNTVAFDASHNLVISGYNCELFVVAAGAGDSLMPGQKLVAGDIYSLIEGNGCGDSGVGGQASTAEIGNITGLAVTPSGNLVMSDNRDNLLWLIAATSADPLVPGPLTPGDIYQSATFPYSSSVGSVAVDGSGNAYLGDGSYANNVVRMVAAATTSPFLPGQTLTPGSAYIVAGTDGNGGFAGDGGPALNAQLYGPYSLALDSSGNVYVVDQRNDRVRKISAATGNISTIAGNGLSYADGIPATQSQINSPKSPVVDSQGDAFIADSNDGTIRMLAGSTSSGFLPGKTLVAGDIYTIAGNAQGGRGNGYNETGDGGSGLQAELDDPTGLRLDSKGNLLIAATSDNTVRLLAATTTSPFLPGKQLVAGDIYLVAGTPSSSGSSGDGGPATSATLSNPDAVTVDASGNLLVADQGNDKIRLVATGSSDSLMPGAKLTAGDIYTVAGGGSTAAPYGVAASSASLRSTQSLAIGAAGNLYVSEGGRIDVIPTGSGDPLLPGKGLTAGDIYEVAGGSGCCSRSGDGGPASSAGFQQLSGLATDSQGNLYVADGGYQAEVRLIAATTGNQLMPGQTLTKGDIYDLGATAGAPQVGQQLSDLCVTAQGNLMFTTNTQVFLAAKVPSPPSAVSASGTNSKISLKWSAPSVAGSGPVTGYRILRSPTGSAANLVPVGTTSGASFADTTAVPGATYLYGVEAVTAYGNTQPAMVSVTEVPANAPVIHTIGGSAASILGPTPFPAKALGQDPQALAIVGSTEYLYDSNDSTIRAVNLTSGSETLVAGNGVEGHTGDAGSALKGEIGNATALTVDASGNLVFPEEDQGYIRLLALTTADKLMPTKMLVKGDLYTVAGDGGFGDAGDGAAATKAAFEDPVGLASDSAGNLLIADDLDSKIRLIAATTSSPLLPAKTLAPGDIYTMAGTGVTTNTGNGGPAVKATLGSPEAITVDHAGNLLMGDGYFGAIRLVAGNINDPLLPSKTLTKGDIYAVAGAGFGSTGDGGPAGQAGFEYFGGLVATASGDLLIADRNDNEIRLLAANTSDGLLPGKPLTKGDIYALAGAGQQPGYRGDGGLGPSAALNTPESIALDGSGNVYLADWANNRVREILASTGKIATVAGNGSLYWDGVSATKSLLQQPPAVSTDATGDLFIADPNDFALRVIPRSTTLPWLPGKTLVVGDIYTLAGNGSPPQWNETIGSGQPATSISIVPEDAIVDPSGNLLVADGSWPDIRLLAGSKGSDPLLPGMTLKPGDMYDVAGAGGSYGLPTFGGKAGASNLLTPLGLATDSVGNLYASIYDTMGQSNGAGYVVLVAGAKSSSLLPGKTLTPGNLYLIAGGSSSGNAGDGGPSAAAQLNQPDGLALDKSGSLTVADFGNNRLRVVAGTTSDTLMPGAKLVKGDIYTLAGGGSSFDYGQPAANDQLGSIAGAALDPSGNLAIDDASSNAIWLVAGTSTRSIAPRRDAQAGRSVQDRRQRDGRLCRRRRAALTGEISAPGGIAFDSTGDLFIADSGNSVVREVPK